VDKVLGVLMVFVLFAPIYYIEKTYPHKDKVGFIIDCIVEKNLTVLTTREEFIAVCGRYNDTQ